MEYVGLFFLTNRGKTAGEWRTGCEAAFSVDQIESGRPTCTLANNFTDLIIIFHCLLAHLMRIACIERDISPDQRQL